MKNLIFIFIVVFFMITTLRSQWDILNEGGQFRTIEFATDSVGWIAGGDKILKTEDGGDTWFEIILNDNINIYKVDFIDETVGWAITANNYDPAGFYRDTYFILKTEDGGSTWNIQKILPGIYLQELQAVDDSTVYISAFTGSWGAPIPKFLKTVDGGDSWIEIPRNENLRKYQSIWFQDADIGIFIGTEYDDYTNPINGIILRTNDGGNTFDEIIIQPYIRMDDFHIINDSTAYFLGGSFICVTNDTLNSWTQLTLNNMNIKSFFRLDDTTFFAIMHDNLTSICFKKSMDAGLTWEEKSSLHWLAPVFFWECDIYFRNKDIGFIASKSNGGTNYLLQTFDGGNEWEIQNFDINLEDIFFIDRYKSFIYGCIAGSIFPGPSTGGMFVSINGGSTWKYFTNRPPGVIGRLIFINELIGFSLSYLYYDGFQIYKTIDGGTSWDNVFVSDKDSLGFNFEGYDIGFLDDNIAYVTGNFGTDTSSGSAILGTTDAGENWDLVWKNSNTNFTDNTLNAIHTFETNAWAVGNNGLILTSVSPDSFTVISGITSLDVKDVFFSDTQHGWIVGGNSSLFKTINSGQTWIEKQFDEYFIFDMYFADSLNGWVVGSDTIFYSTGTPALESGNGVILNTIDGGENWTVQREDLSAPINALHFKDGYGWAAGGNGLILRTDDGSTWVQTNCGQIFPKRITLNQNYPNPFNPSTKITFTLPKPEHITLEVYNTIGQKVATLLDTKMNAGSHDVQFDASTLPSGIYFYRIQAGKFSQVRKMVLLR